MRMCLAILPAIGALLGGLMAYEAIFDKDAGPWIVATTLCLMIWSLWELFFWLVVGMVRLLRWLVWDVKPVPSGARTTRDRTDG